MLILRPKSRVCNGTTLAHPLPKKFKRVSSAEKKKWLLLLSSQCIIMVNSLEEDRTINGAYYAEELRWLCQESVKKKKRGQLTPGVLLLQYNAYTPQVTMAAANRCSFKVLPHPLDFPDLAPSHFYMFPNLKTNLSGRNFESSVSVVDAVDEYLGDQDEGFYSEWISKLEQHWRKCIEAKEDYIWEIMAQFLLLVIPKV